MKLIDKSTQVKYGVCINLYRYCKNKDLLWHKRMVQHRILRCNDLRSRAFEMLGMDISIDTMDIR